MTCYNLLMTCLWLAFDLLLTCFWLAFDLLLTCFGLALTCFWLAFDLLLTCFFTYDLLMTCSKPVKHYKNIMITPVLKLSTVIMSSDWWQSNDSYCGNRISWKHIPSESSCIWKATVISSTEIITPHSHPTVTLMTKDHQCKFLLLILFFVSPFIIRVLIISNLNDLIIC